MKSYRNPSLLDVCTESAQGLVDIFTIGTALEEPAPDADARNLNYDVQQIGDDFRRVMSQIESGDFDD